MNYQSKSKELMLIDHDGAYNMLREKFPDTYPQLDYYAWPRVYGNTAGPFSYPGRVSGAAMSTFTLEAWSDGHNALIFCKGKVIEIKDFPSNGFNPLEYR